MGDELRVEGVGDHTNGFMFNLKVENITPLPTSYWTECVTLSELTSECLGNIGFLWA